MKAKKVTYIVFSVFAAVIALAGVFFIVAFNLNKDLSQPVSITENQGQVFLKAQQEDEGYGYTFRFRQGVLKTEIESLSSILTVETMLEKGVSLGEGYLVSVAVNRENFRGENEFSNEIKWVAKDYLKTPTITVEGGFLKISDVPESDYFRIYYGGNYFETTQNEVKLSGLKGGTYDIFVKAFSSKDYIFSSVPSETLKNVEILHEIPKISGTSFVKISNKLIVQSKENFEDVFVKFSENGTVYTVQNEKFEIVDGFYNITFNLEVVYEDETQIFVKPVAKAGESVYNFDFSVINL